MNVMEAMVDGENQIFMVKWFVCILTTLETER